jgi:hypothetical protein
MSNRTTWEIHSHNYKKDIYAQLQYEISEKLRTCPQPTPALIEKMVSNWLNENTELGSRTKKEYISHNIPKIQQILA